MDNSDKNRTDTAPVVNSGASSQNAVSAQATPTTPTPEPTREGAPQKAADDKPLPPGTTVPESATASPAASKH